MENNCKREIEYLKALGYQVINEEKINMIDESFIFNGKGELLAHVNNALGNEWVDRSNKTTIRHGYFDRGYEGKGEAVCSQLAIKSNDGIVTYETPREGSGLVSMFTIRDANNQQLSINVGYYDDKLIICGNAFTKEFNIVSKNGLYFISSNMNLGGSKSPLEALEQLVNGQGEFIRTSLKSLLPVIAEEMKFQVINARRFNGPKK